MAKIQNFLESLRATNTAPQPIFFHERIRRTLSGVPDDAQEARYKSPQAVTNGQNLKTSGSLARTACN
jgi:hypothetical protein